MRTFLVTAVALFTLAACSSGTGGAGPSPSPTAMSDAEILALGKQVAQCIRDNGVPAFPDPYVDHGRLKLPEDQMTALESQNSKQVLDQAQQACRSLLDKLPESALRDSGQNGGPNVPGPGDVDALRKFAQCMRDNGIPEFPDPKADGSFPLRGTPLQTEGKSQRMITALQACNKYWSGGITFS